MCERRERYVKNMRDKKKIISISFNIYDRPDDKGIIYGKGYVKIVMSITVFTVNIHVLITL